MSRHRVDWLFTGMGITLVGAVGCGANDQGDVRPASGLESVDASTDTPPAAIGQEVQRASVLAAYTASRQAEGKTDARYHLVGGGGSLAGLNAAQGFTTRIDARGFEVAHEKGAWRARFETVAIRCGNERIEVGASELREVGAQPHRARIDRKFGRAGLEEWAVNGPLGLEQGYTITHDPCRRHAGEMAIEIGVSGVTPEAHGSVVELRDEQGNARARYGKLYAEDAEGRPIDGVLAVEGSRILIRLKTEGVAWPVTVDPLLWAQLAKLASIGGAPGDHFGESVSLSGTTALVGAPEFGAPEGVRGKGAAYVFTKGGTGWVQQAKLMASDGISGDLFGRSVALSGSTALVGAQSAKVGNSPYQGAVYVFAQEGVGWSQQAKLTANDGLASDQFGTSVALLGNAALIGARGAEVGSNIDQGAAYVFVRAGASWSQQAKLTATKGTEEDYFGSSVSLSETTALVGAPGVGASYYQGPGAAYVFALTGSSWSQQAKLTAGDGAAQALFGSSVALSGSTALVGAPGAAIGSMAGQGAAYVFAQSGKTWPQQAKLLAGDGTFGDQFGYSVALLGTTAVVGAPWAKVGYNYYQGTAYVFLQAGSAWSEHAKLVASDGEQEDYFGWSAAISDTTVLIGANEWGMVQTELGAGRAYIFDVVGAPCSSDDECPASSYCVDGVCCNTSCAGPCAVCAQALGASADGLCTPAPQGSVGIPSCDFGRLCDGEAFECPITCTDNTQCFPSEWCDGTTCWEDFPTGSGCEFATECLSGFCVDGVCCDAPCTGLCTACNTALKGHGSEGICEAIADGLDPESECGQLGSSPACVSDGVCDGLGLCRVASKGKVCGNSSCASATTQTTAPKCDATGVCQSDGAVDCGAYVCAGGACKTSCTGDADCASGYGCKDGACVTGSSLPDGAICSISGDCASWFCVDGVCCNAPCVGFCQACTAALKGHGADGVCEPIADGLDPQNECPTQGVDAVCASDGVCNGAELCRASSQGNLCGASSCANADTQLNPPKCNAVGACETAGSADCGAYVCSGIACKTTCATDVDCHQPGFYCSAGVCVARLSEGAPCADGKECLSGYCADGVCCDLACNQLCQACSASKKGSGADGICEAIGAGQDPDNECDTEDPSTCQKDGTCDGKGNCRLHAKATPCGSSCVGNAVSTRVCDGFGACTQGPDSTDCGAYLCIGTGCAKPCATDAQCATGNSCVTGECQPAGAVGSPCTSAATCASGFCADGVCCNTECKGQCESCNEQGSPGVCAAVSGNPRSPRPACEGVGACLGSCNGTVRTECTYPGPAVSCGSACQNGVQTASSCNGAGHCIPGTDTPCAPYVCDGASKCKTSCSTALDCAKGATCDGTGRCVSGDKDAGLNEGGGGAGSGDSGAGAAGGALATASDEQGGCSCRIVGVVRDRRMPGGIASLGLLAVFFFGRRGGIRIRIQRSPSARTR